MRDPLILAAAALSTYLGLLMYPWAANSSKSLLRAFAEGMFLPLACDAELVGAQ